MNAAGSGTRDDGYQVGVIVCKAKKAKDWEVVHFFKRVEPDATLARKVCGDDDFVDNLTHQIFRELLTYMIEDPHSISRAVRITFVSKYLERMADHATNVAELVVYLVEGKIIRHTST